MRESTVCFTGHRPHKFSFELDEENEKCRWLKEQLKDDIKRKIQNGADTFLCGMAWGSDIWCGEIIMELKTQFQSIKLIACIPHLDQENSWNQTYKARYARLFACADDRVILHNRYVRGCMQNRNQYMVDHAAHIIAVYSGSVGGTQATVKYASKKGLDIIILDPEKMSRKHVKSQGSLV